MKISEIKEGGVYFYNNRPIKVLGIELNGSIRVSGDFQLMNDLEGRNWCTHCMVGGHDTGYLGECTADDTQDVIDAVLDDIGGTEVFWVHSADYLKENPFEWKENEELKQEIFKKKKEIEQLSYDRSAMGDEVFKLQKERDDLLRDQESLEEKQKELGESISTMMSDLFFYEQKKKEIEENPKIIEDKNYKYPVLQSILDTMSYVKKNSYIGHDDWDESIEITIYGVRYYFKYNPKETTKDYDAKWKYKWRYYELMMEDSDGKGCSTGYKLEVVTTTSNDGNYSTIKTNWI
jgi:hypothetical protein